MFDTLMLQIEQLLADGQRLLAQSQAETWESFADEVESYARQLALLSEHDYFQLDVFLRSPLQQQLQRLLLQDQLVRQVIQTRMNVLSNEMSTTRKSRHSAQAYNTV